MENKDKQKIAVTGASIAGGLAAYILARKMKISPNKKLATLQKFFSKAGREPSIIVSGAKSKNLNKLQRYAINTFEQSKQPLSSVKPKTIVHGFNVRAIEKKAPKDIIGFPTEEFKEAIKKPGYMNRLDKAGIGIESVQIQGKAADMIKGAKSDKAVINILDNAFGKNKYIVKPSSDIAARSYNSAMKKAGKSIRIGTSEGQSALIHSSSKNSKQMEAFRDIPDFFMVQPKLNIAKEFRVRTVNGQVVSVLDRYPTKMEKKIGAFFGEKGEGFGLIPHSEYSPNRRAIEKMFNKHKSVLETAGHNTAAYDIAQLKGGKYVVIEKNIITGADLENPFVAEAVYRAATGKDSSRQAIAKGALASLGIGAAGSTGVAIYNKNTKNRRQGDA